MEHGRRATYVYHGCRCARCTAANAEYVREQFRRTHPSRKVRAAPYTRLLSWLYIRGESVAQIKDTTGCGKTTIQRVMMGERATIQRRTAERLAQAVWLVPPSDRHLFADLGGDL